MTSLQANRNVFGMENRGGNWGGDKMVLACFDEIVELRQEVSQLRETLESLAIDFISDSDRIEIAVAAINKAKGI